MRLLEKEQNRSFSLMVMFSIKNARANVNDLETRQCATPSSFVQAVQLILKKKSLRLCHLLCLENS